MDARTETEGGAPGQLRLWTGVLLAPTVFLLALTLDFALVHAVCADGASPAVLHLGLGTLFLVALAGGGTAWRNWSASGRRPADAGASATARSRFLAVLGLMLSGLVALLFLVMWLAIALLDPCVRY